MKIHFPSESTRRASSSRTRASPGSSLPQHDDHERRPHPELCDCRPPRRARDPPVEAVHEEQLEDDVRDVPGDEHDEGRAQICDATEISLRAEREERGRESDRRNAQVRDGVVRCLTLASHERDELRSEHGDEPRDGDAERERQPDRLRAEAPRRLLLPGATRTSHLRGRAVLEEVEDREGAAEDRDRDPERGELGPTEMSDDRRVDEEVERFGRERAQRREREPEDLAVVLGAEGHPVAWMVASYAAT